MKRFFRIFAAVALVCTTFVACEEKFDDYDPAAVESTAQVYFSKDTATTIDILGKESVEIPVMRAVNGAGITVPITATVDAEYADSFTIPTSVNFADGETATSLVITFDPATLEYGESYDVTLQISSDLITDYGRDLITLTLDYPEPFVSLGVGTFADTFFFENVYDVEILQNSLNPTVFRLVAPYAEGLDVEGYSMEAGPAEYVEFRLLQPGEKLWDVEITRDDLVYFPSYMTGFYHTSYSAEVWAHHPSTFTYYTTEEHGAHSKVVEWQENGLPGIVQFAPHYYMDGIGGWNNTTYDGVVTIVFPGFELKDFAVSVASAGMKVVDGKAYPVVDATFGADVAQLQMAVLEGHYQNMESVWSQVPALVEAGQVKSVIVDAVDQDSSDEVASMSIVGAEALPAGIYTAFVYPIDAEGVAQTGEIKAVSFYMNEVSTDVPEMDFNFMTMSANELFSMFGVDGGFDDATSMAWFATGSNIESWKQVVAGASSVQSLLDKGATLEQIALAYGDDWDLSYINVDGYDYNYYDGLEANTSYMIVNYVKDLYGNVSATASLYTTAPAAEEGEATATFNRKNVSLSTDVVLRSNLMK